MLFRFFRPENCCIKGGPPTRYKAHLLIHRIRCNKQLVHSEEAISANLSCSFSLWGSDEHRCNECFCLFHCDIHTVQNSRRVQEYRTYSADLDFTRSQVSYEMKPSESNHASSGPSAHRGTTQRSRLNSYCFQGWLQTAPINATFRNGLQYLRSRSITHITTRSRGTMRVIAINPK